MSKVWNRNIPERNHNLRRERGRVHADLSGNFAWISFAPAETASGIINRSAPRRDGAVHRRRQVNLVGIVVARIIKNGVPGSGTIVIICRGSSASTNIRRADLRPRKALLGLRFGRRPKAESRSGKFTTVPQDGLAREGICARMVQTTGTV